MDIDDENLIIDTRPTKKSKVKTIVDSDSDDTVEDNTDDTSEKTEKMSKQELSAKIETFLKPNSTLSASPGSFLELPTFLSGVIVYIYGHIDPPEQKLLERIIIAFAGEIKRDFTDEITHVITSSMWDNFLQQVATKHKHIKIVRPSWVIDCNRNRKKVSEVEHKVTKC